MKKRGRKILYLIIAVLVILILSLTALVLFQKENCETYECFQKNMKKCLPALYLNSEPQADWRYEIKGITTEGCEVKVKLLQAKQGELGIDKLQGYEMSCFYPLGTAAYPERDLSACHGRLKEELQGIIIEKLHTHILENLGKIDEGLNSAV